MHDIEPYYRWRQYYIAEEDERSPFYGRQYSEFEFSNKIYNYFIHPQWDSIGSSTLYVKILYVDYTKGIAMIELIGEWNDCLYNDIMILKRDLADHLIKNGINKFILFCDNVLNFHSSDDCYYEEWWDDIKYESGYICLVNTLDHIEDEMIKVGIHHYTNCGEGMEDVVWRNKSPEHVIVMIDQILNQTTKKLLY